MLEKMPCLFYRKKKEVNFLKIFGGILICLGYIEVFGAVFFEKITEITLNAGYFLCGWLLVLVGGAICYVGEEKEKGTKSKTITKSFLNPMSSLMILGGIVVLLLCLKPHLRSGTAIMMGLGSLVLGIFIRAKVLDFLEEKTNEKQEVTVIQPQNIVQAKPAEEPPKINQPAEEKLTREQEEFLKRFEKLEREINS